MKLYSTRPKRLTAWHSSQGRVYRTTPLPLNAPPPYILWNQSHIVVHLCKLQSPLASQPLPTSVHHLIVSVYPVFLHLKYLPIPLDVKTCYQWSTLCSQHYFWKLPLCPCSNWNLSIFCGHCFTYNFSSGVCLYPVPKGLQVVASILLSPPGNSQNFSTPSYLNKTNKTQLLWIPHYFVYYSLLLASDNPPVTPLYSLTIWATGSLGFFSPLFLSYFGCYYHLHRSFIQPLYPRVP